MIKAIQELSAENTALKARVAALESSKILKKGESEPEWHTSEER